MGLATRVWADKRPWDDMAQSICEQCYPIRASYNRQVALGDSYAQDLMDSTPVNAREELGNTIDAMLRQGPWFKLGTGDDDRDQHAENAKPLERGTMLMMKGIEDPRMGFKTATKEADHDYVSVGQAVLSVEDTIDRRFVRVRAWHPASCAWWNDEDGNLIAMFRKLSMPVAEIARAMKTGRWNGGDLPVALQTLLGKEPNTKVKLMHCFCRTEMIYGDLGEEMRKHKNSEWLSVYMWIEGSVALHEFGEPLNFYVTPGWRKLSDMPYAISPAGLNSLGDERMLQQLAMIILETGEKSLDPPMVGSAEVFTRDINMMSGGFTYVDLPEDASLRDVMATIPSGELRAGLELKQDARACIIDAWLLNKLYLPSAKDMRELEVAVRTEEFRRAALPFFQPIETDYHPALLGRIFDRMMLRKLIPADMFPPSLGGMDIHWSFTSPLNEAEGRKVVEAYNMSVQSIAAGAQIDETVGTLFDMKVATMDAVRGAGAKASWILTGKALKQKQAEADQAKQLADASAIANQTALTASNMSAAKQAVDGSGLMEEMQPAA